MKNTFNIEAEASIDFHKVYRASLRKPNVKDFLSVLYDIYENDTFILSSSFHIVEYCGTNYDFMKITYQDNEQLMLNKNIENKLKQQKIFQKGAFLLDEKIFSVPVLITSVYLNGKIVGFLCVIQSQKIFTQKDILFSEYVVELMSQLLYEKPLENSVENMERDSFLINLLNGNRSNIEAYAEVWNCKHYLNQSYYQLLVFNAHPVVDQKTNIHFLRQLKHLFPHMPVIQNTHMFIVLLYGKKKELLSDETKQVLEDFLSLHQQYGIISFDYFDIYQTTEMYDYISNILPSLYLQNNTCTYLKTMEELYFQILMFSNHTHMQKYLLIHPDILFLRRYDAKYNTELTKTLKMYIKCNRNITNLAEVMHLSRSTGFYRINMIKDLLNNPFDSATRLFCYECSFQLLENI